VGFLIYGYGYEITFTMVAWVTFAASAVIYLTID